jgi:hypothetical protein
MSGKTRDCYIDVWREANFEGEAIRIYGPAEHPDLLFTQGDWGDRIGSLRVGPNAFVLAYSDQNFANRMVAFGPNDAVADLCEMKFDDDIESIKVIESLKIFDRLTYEDSPTVDAQYSQSHPTRTKHHGRNKRH